MMTAFSFLGELSL